MYSNFYDYCCEIRDRKNSKVPENPKYETLEDFENKYIQSGYQKIIKTGFRSILSNLNLNEDEYLFDFFDIGNLIFESILDTPYYKSKRKNKAIYYTDVSVLYYSESMNKFLSKKCRILMMTNSGNDPGVSLKYHLLQIYADEFNKSMAKYLNYTEELNAISKEILQQEILGKIRSKIIEKPMTAPKTQNSGYPKGIRCRFSVSVRYLILSQTENY